MFDVPAMTKGPAPMRCIPRLTLLASAPILFLLPLATLAGAAEPVVGVVRDDVLRVELLPPGPDNPRNSEGDFIHLKDGRLLFVYTHFTGGAGDHAKAHLAGRYSADGGQSWTAEDQTILANEGGMNVMSVSLLRLADGRIAMFYLRKNSQADCRPFLRISDDEAETWSEPVAVVPDVDTGYYVLNNDRVIQLDSGRLVAPLAQHYDSTSQKWDPNARQLCYFSDDAGKTWTRGADAPAPDPVAGKAVLTQEPGVVELKDGRLMLYCRTNAGSQYVAYSRDEGGAWSKLEPSNIISPLSPATIERLPSTGDLLLVWNDHRDVEASLRGKRTPLRTAISTDDGKTWSRTKTLENDPNGWYCYTAMAFVDDHVLLAYCAGDRSENNGLAMTRVSRLPLDWTED